MSQDSIKSPAERGEEKEKNVKVSETSIHSHNIKVEENDEDSQFQKEKIETLSNKNPSSKQIIINDGENKASTLLSKETQNKNEKIKDIQNDENSVERSKESLPVSNSQIIESELLQKSIKEISNEFLCKDIKEVSKTFTQSAKSEKRKKNGSKKNKKGKKNKSAKWVY